MKILYFPTPADFRRWLETNHAALDDQRILVLHVGFYKKSSGKPSITYHEAVDEALCFGWIDGVRHSVDAEAYTVRFTERRPQSQWSAVNIRRAKQLVAEGRMHPAGLKAFEGAESQPRKYSYEQRNQAAFDAASERKFRANRRAWDYFQAQAPWYRRTATFWVTSAKQEETRQRRLGQLIEACASSQPVKPLARPLARPASSKSAASKSASKSKKKR
jgi:uncharacterized protein YdeI (YjbR/CyaY-like superfamily)